MNVSNLSQNYQKLLDHMKVHGYSKAHTAWIKKCIKAVLSDGAQSEIKSYDQLYWYEIEKWGWKEGAQCRKAFKSTLRCVKLFDLEGKYPNWKHQSSIDDKPQKYDLLSDIFKIAIDRYVAEASMTTKREKTIHDEKMRQYASLHIYSQEVRLNSRPLAVLMCLVSSLTEKNLFVAMHISVSLCRY